jgi:hypothetical protein
MALFTKNKNRAALFGKQTLYDKCCTPEVEECCYPTDPLPRPPAPPPCQECGFNLGRNYIVNGVSYGNVDPIIIDTTDLPAIIEVFFGNDNRECDATFGKFTSDTPSPNISITTYSPDTIAPGNVELVATIQLNTVLGPGTYTPYINYSICGDNYALGIDIQIDAV